MSRVHSRRSPARSCWAWALISTFGGLACAETEGLGLDGGGVDAGSLDGGFSEDAGPIDFVRIRGNVTRTNEAAIMTTPLSGATVCQTQPSEGPCVMTEADGTYELAVRADVEVLLEIGALDFPNYLLPLRTGVVDGNLNLPMLPADVIASWGALTGGNLSPSRGVVIVQVAAADATVSLSPPDARIRAYTDAAGGAPNPGLRASSAHGFAIFLDVPPGEHMVRVEHPSRSCRRGLGWAGAADNQARGLVAAGTITRLTVACR